MTRMTRMMRTTQTFSTMCALTLTGLVVASTQDPNQNTQETGRPPTDDPLVLGLPVRTSELPGTLTLPVIESAVVESDGWVFLLGGMTSDFNATPAIQSRRPDGAWLPVGSQMSEARINPEALKLSDGRILIWGGYGGSAKGVLNLRLDGEIVQPKIAGASTPITPPEESRWVTPSAPKQLSDGTIGVIAENGLHRFDLENLTWHPAEPLGRKVSAATLDVLEDGTLIACGTNPDDQSLVVMERPRNETTWTAWSVAEKISALGARSRMLPDGRVLLLGWPQKDERPSPETLIIDTARKTVVAGPKLPFKGGVPTWMHAITVPNGVVVLASEQPTSDELAMPTALFIRAERSGRLRPWRLNDLPRRRRPNVLSVGNGLLELFGGYRFTIDGASMAIETNRVKYGTGLVGD